MNTITTEQQNAIAEKLASMYLPSGLGNEHSACSIAAINLSLTGELTDDIPECMSEVIGHWIIGVQDAMPDEMRNSAEWKYLLPLAAGTGMEKEQERLAIILDWMWGTVLPSLQFVAAKKGFGDAWARMTTERTKAAAAVHLAWAAEAVHLARAAEAAAWAAGSAWAARAAEAAAWAAGSAEAAGSARAAEAGSARARAARAAEAAGQDSWATFDPVGLLDRLIKA